MKYIQLLRPHQWLKNLILFFPPFMGGALLRNGGDVAVLVPFAAFCLVSSATYVVNDISDRNRDRQHSKKSLRPLASGAVSISAAMVLTIFLLSLAMALAWWQPPMFMVWLAAYLLLSLAYSFGLKNLPVVDLFCIASGFVFRLFAGGVAYGIEISDWLFLSVLLLALFLSCGKRLAEKRLLGENSTSHRQVLAAYPPGSLEGFMYMSGAAVLVTYMMYVITKHRLVYTVPLCCFGLFRYVLLIRSGKSGDPTDSLLKDPILFLVGLAWITIVGIGTYLMR